MTWPPRAIGPILKPSRTKRLKTERRDLAKLDAEERQAKAKVTRRDRVCRFPLCGCRRLGFALKARPEVSHRTHKGMGGNPAGDRSTPALMVLLCAHRHQFGAVSRHAGTLREKFLTRDKYNGPVAWEIDVAATASPRRTKVHAWREVARERSVGVLEPLADWQREILERLAEMEL